MLYSTLEVVYMANDVLTNVGARENVLLKKVYLWMTLGLFITAAVAVGVGSSEALLRTLALNPISVIVLCVLQIALVIVLSARIEKLSAGAAIGIFLGYSALTGVTFSSLFCLYVGTGIIEKAFFSTAVVFVVASLYGMFTKRAVQGMRGWLMVGLISIIIASLFNIFIGSTVLDLGISVLGILLFTGITIWDTNKIKGMNDSYGYEMTSDELNKISILGALDIYLDFLNIFLYFVRIYAKSNKN